MNIKCHQYDHTRSGTAKSPKNLPLSKGQCPTWITWITRSLIFECTLAQKKIIVDIAKCTHALVYNCVTTSRVTFYYNDEKIQDCMRSLPNDKGAYSSHTFQGLLEWSYIPKDPRMVTRCKGTRVVKWLQINICSFVLFLQLARVFHFIPFLQLTKHNFCIYDFVIRSSF